MDATKIREDSRILVALLIIIHRNLPFNFSIFLIIWLNNIIFAKEALYCFTFVLAIRRKT